MEGQPRLKGGNTTHAHTQTRILRVKEEIAHMWFHRAVCDDL